MHKIALATAALLPALGAALAQESSGQQLAATPLPEQCRQSETQQMEGMAGMSNMDASGMDEAHQAFMSGMMRMHPAMMQALMAEDPDVAFACGMIAHHQGAIDMANVELKYGDNDQTKQMAQQIIDDQTNEIAEFTQWLKANAK
jgi:uncharacterized protein (DUF305 family)